MKSALAILTYNRLPALRTFTAGLDQHCTNYPMLICEDRGLRDDTHTFLSGTMPNAVASVQKLGYRHDMLADHVRVKFQINTPTYDVFLGTRNLGVAGNSNRALRWFMEETDADHLCLCNDDLCADGDFINYYAEAHKQLNMHLFCFCDFTSETYKWVPIKVRVGDRDFTLKLLPRMTGIMMSITRKLVSEIGYFDPVFGKAGEEHCDYTNRARFSGATRLNGQDLHCIDIEQNPVLLRHQDIDSSLLPHEKPTFDAIAAGAMGSASKMYLCTSWYRPCHLVRPKFAGAYESGGVDIHKLPSTPLVVEQVAAHTLD
jgi:GT2 family glycosyltransferase